MRAVLLAALPLIVAGCFGHCGPSAGSVLDSAILPAQFQGNETVLRQALLDQGFEVTPYPPFILEAKRPGLRVSVSDALDNATMQVQLHFDGASKEFPDTPAGRDQALAYDAQRINETRPAAQAVVDGLAAALGVPSTPVVVPEEPSYSIC